jgi:excisionase family DNA binding protein
MEKLALTVAEAAALGGPCRSVLYQDIASGRLRAVKRGRSTRILLDDFKSYLASLPSIPVADNMDSQVKVDFVAAAKSRCTICT